MADRQTVTSENADEFYADRLPKREETPAADDTGKPDAKTTEAGSESNTTEKPRKPIQPRINELVGERNAARDEAERARREAEQTRQELDEIKRKLQVLETPATIQPISERPTRSQFATDEDFQEALTDWKVDKRMADQRAQEQADRQKALAAQMDENWQERVTQAQALHDDFDAVVGAADVELAAVVLGAIKESEVGPQLAYQLAKDGGAEAKRLRSMTITAQLRELGKLEAKLMAEPAKPAAKPEGKKPVVEKSNAPEPIDPLKGASAAVGKDRAGMSYDEWKAARKAGQIK